MPKPRILVIDDDPDVRETVQLFLEKAGHPVISAPDGLAGLETLNQLDFGIVITDFNMPHMNGLEVIAKIREAGNNLPIVLFAGGDVPEKVDYDNVLVCKKGCGPSQLLQAVESLSQNLRC